MRQTTMTVSVITDDENEQPIRDFTEFVQGLDGKYQTVYVNTKSRSVLVGDGGTITPVMK